MLPINTDHYMIDIETFGTEVSSIILSIGVAKFDEAGIITTFTVDIDTNQPRTVDLSTIKWWMEQTTPAPVNGSVQLPAALQELTKFIQDTREAEKVNIWCAGTDFDTAILSHAYKQFGMETPWQFRDTRDYRTIRKVFEDFGNEKASTMHNALMDAQDQAIHLVSILKNLGEIFDEQTNSKTTFTN